MTGALLATAILMVAQAPVTQTPASDHTTSLPAERASERLSAADQQRLTDWVALIEGQNTPQARLTGARELLRTGRIESYRRLVGILTGSNRPARIAVALALADQPSMSDSVFVAPLVALFSDDDADTRQAVAAAIAKGGAMVIPRLAELLTDAQQPLIVKLSAIDALGRMTQRGAIAVLVDALADPASPLCKAALAALERATAQDFQNDPSRALRWWEDTRSIDAASWQQLQIDRLVHQSGTLSQRVRELESRLATAQRDGFFRAAESERTALLATFLADPLDVVRLLGLDLVQTQLTEGKPPAPETVAKVRELLTTADARVRAAAVRCVASLRDPADAERFAQMLATETNSDGRQALVYGLGYVGGSEVVPPLLA